MSEDVEYSEKDTVQYSTSLAIIMLSGKGRTRWLNTFKKTEFYGLVRYKTKWEYWKEKFSINEKLIGDQLFEDYVSFRVSVDGTGRKDIIKVASGKGKPSIIQQIFQRKKSATYDYTEESTQQ